jgi:hypothetical protein
MASAGAVWQARQKPLVPSRTRRSQPVPLDLVAPARRPRELQPAVGREWRPFGCHAPLPESAGEDAATDQYGDPGHSGRPDV